MGELMIIHNAQKLGFYITLKIAFVPLLNLHCSILWHYLLSPHVSYHDRIRCCGAADFSMLQQRGRNLWMLELTVKCSYKKFQN